jgi:hypothetical protein
MVTFGYRSSKKGTAWHMRLGERFIEQLESPAKTGFGDIHKKYYSNSAIPEKIEK